jgi:dinuclear metal center YbgI/SA1388 family protein
MPTIADVVEALEAFAPSQLAEDWDNVGLVVGDRSRDARRAMTCLTLTEDVADEAIAGKADLVITHHPLPFRPLKRLTTESQEGRTLWKLVGAGVSVYSPHTALDSAAGGINQQLAEGLNLAEITPLLPADPSESTPTVGAGRCGAVLEPTDIARLVANTCELLSIDHVRVVGNDEQPVARVAVACGSGGSLLEAAIDQGADALVTGEATFHNLLAARGAGVAVVLTGHYASERFALERLAEHLGSEMPTLQVWASRDECDPLRLVTR